MSRKAVGLPGMRPLSFPARAARPGIQRRSPRLGLWLWIPAFAGMTSDPPRVAEGRQTLAEFERAKGESQSAACRGRLSDSPARLSRPHDDLLRRRGFEIAYGVGFERWLIAFEREKIAGAVSDDLVGDVELVFSGTESCARVRRAFFGVGAEPYAAPSTSCVCRLCAARSCRRWR